MAQLKDKVENALNETRVLVLGIQVLIGFAFRSFFEPGFATMSPESRLLQLVALGLMLVCMDVLLIPVPCHRLVMHGHNTPEFHRIATATVSVGLLPFALSMAISFYLSVHWLAGELTSAVVAGLALATALYFWYGLEIAVRKRKLGGLHLHAVVDPLRGIEMKEEGPTDLTTRVKQVLIECRVVLPGAQALLGFQLVIMWMTDFAKVPYLWKILHLASLTSIALCTILLIAPAAYHRIVYRGEDSEELHDFTSKALLWAMGFLGLGICGDFYIVARVTGLSTETSGLLSLALLVCFAASWFGYSLWKKHNLALHNAEAALFNQPSASH